MFHEKLNEFSISTLMITTSYDDGYFKFPCSDYFTKSYLYLQKSIELNAPYIQNLEESFKKMALAIYMVESDYRYQEIKKIMEEHKEATNKYIEPSLWDDINESVTKQNYYSKKAHQSVFRIPDDNLDMAKVVADRNVIDGMLVSIMNEFPERDLTDDFPVVNYVHEPFSDIKIQFDEFGKSSRIEFNYLGSRVSYRIKAEPQMGHGAYGYSDEYSYNLFDGGYIDSDNEDESVIASVLRYFLIMGRKLSNKSRNQENRVKLDEQIKNGEVQHLNMFSIHDEYKRLNE
ncbi:hypothetical protein [Colwellia psychrerythraea]|uniref:Uncharacterized protein n=1 Tax=Colwellia psychrerythraea TaxID=28229 RepID=A0A099KBF1_COLPS|nr:hypothetical protein [Colwellia psychrerythraea]KGJ87641.1 hypothetical protein ND2E_4379 [Colwellia psychrerythraea]